MRTTFIVHGIVLVLALLGCRGNDKDTGGEPDTDTGDPTATDPFAVVDPRDVVSVEDEEALQAELDALVTEQGVMGAQLAVWLDGELVLLQTTGTRRSGDSTPVDRDTLFQLGSNTKMLTAVTALQQVDAGRLRLDDTMDAALGGFELSRSPEWSGTLHELLSHQGDLYDLWDPRQAPDDAAMADGVAAFASNGWAYAPSGTTFNYSNTHYSLVGRAAEVAAGEPWADVFEQRVAEPLGMSRTIARTADAIADGNYCLGELWLPPADSDPYNPLDTWDPAWHPVGDAAPEDAIDNAFTRPAALVWSTAVDELRFAAFLVDGDPDVLSDASRAAMVTPWVEELASRPGNAYGYGLFISPGLDIRGQFVETPFWSHSGNTATHASSLVIVPDARFAFSVVATGTFTSLGDVNSKVVKRLLPDMPEGTGPVWLDEETDPSRLVGTYTDPELGPIVVELDEGELTVNIATVTAAGYEVRGSLPYSGSTDVYELRITNDLGYMDFTVTFLADEEGTYRWLVSRYLGGERAE